MTDPAILRELIEAADGYLAAVQSVRKNRLLTRLYPPVEKEIARIFTKQRNLLAGKLRGREDITSSDLARIFDAISTETREEFSTAIQAAVVAGMLAGSSKKQLGAVSEGEDDNPFQKVFDWLQQRINFQQLRISSTFNLKNPRAVTYLEKHGAELVSKVDDTTRKQLQTVLVNGMKKGWSYQRTAKELQKKFEFTSCRSKMIAVTEIGNAYEEARWESIQEMMDSGLKMEKKWITTDPCPICSANGAQGWIPADELFASGDMKPTAHPNCKCDVLYRVAKDQTKGKEINKIGMSPNTDELKTVSDAVVAGRTAWPAAEKVIEDKLTQYELVDDITRTIGLWDNPEPSFNVLVKGAEDNVKDFSKDWGKLYNQNAMVGLIPDVKGEAGALYYDFKKKLKNEELDLILQGIMNQNDELRKLSQIDSDYPLQYIGLSVKNNRFMEFWFENAEQRVLAKNLFNTIIEESNLITPKENYSLGYRMFKLFSGEDY